MSKTLAEVRIEIARRLGDSTATVWTAAEIDRYLKEGYNRLAMETLAFWDYAYLPDAAGGLNDLPGNFYKMDRATWDNQRIEPLTSRELEGDPGYHSTAGPTVAYAMDKDGLMKIRRYPATAGTGSYEVTGTWGIPRDLGDIDASTPTGTWGTLRNLSGTMPEGDAWGIARDLGAAAGNLKIEYFRRGISLSGDDSAFELPDVYVKYVRHFAMWKTLERDGPGQDTQMAEHYRLRWLAGVNRLLRRKRVILSNRTGRFGGEPLRAAKPPRPQLPWRYGKVVR